MEFENLLTLINTVSDSKLTCFKYEENGVKISLSKTEKGIQVVGGLNELNGVGLSGIQASAGIAVPEVNVAAVQENTVNTANVGAEPAGKIVKSPLVGTFYAAPAEDAEPFVSVGDKVKKGQTLAIIEAMKLMNEIESDFDGSIAEIYVENGQAVEYGQPLFRIS